MFDMQQNINFNLITHSFFKYFLMRSGLMGSILGATCSPYALKKFKFWFQESF